MLIFKQFINKSMIRLLVISLSLGIVGGTINAVVYADLDSKVGLTYPIYAKNKNNDLTAYSGKFLTELTDARKKEIVTRLFRTDGALKFGTQTLEDYSLQELNIIANSNVPNVYKAIDKTETAAGSAVLSALLSNPVSDLSVIKKRQELIKFLLENEELFNHLNNYVTELKDGENALLIYWNDDAVLDENVKGLIYSPKGAFFSYLNRSPKYHQLCKIANGFQLIVTALMMPSAVLGCTVSPLLAIGNLLAGGDPALSIGLGLQTLGALFMFYTSKMYINYIRLIHRTIFTMHQRLRHVSKLTQNFDELFYVMRNHEKLYNGLSLVSNMSDFVLILNRYLMICIMQKII